MEKQKIDYELRNQLFELHITPRLGYVYKICIKMARAPDHIPELNNEVLTTLLKGIMTYDPSLPVLRWIHTVAKRRIWKIYSRRSILRDDYVDIDRVSSGMIYNDCDACYDMEESLSPGMMAAIEMLKPAQKTATILKIQNHTIPEIAKILYDNELIKTLNNNTAKSVLFNARSKLSKLVDRDGRLIPPPPRKPRKPREAKMKLIDDDSTNPQTNDTMAKLKSELDKYITLHEKEYFDLIESKLLIEALKIAGVEDLPMYKAANAILKDARVEIHLKPIQRNYR